MKIQHFFDPETFTLTYVVSDEATKDAVIIDPVLDFDTASGKINDSGLGPILTYISDNNLKVKGILETHAHADHLSSSQILKQLFPEAMVGISERIMEVQTVFKEHFNMATLKTNGCQFDLLFKAFEEVNFGGLK